MNLPPHVHRARVSVDDREVSLAAQEAGAREWCERNGHVVTHCYPVAPRGATLRGPMTAPSQLAEIEARAAAADEATRAEKRDAIVRALAEHGGNRTRAAEALGYHNAAKLRRAAARAGLDLATIPAPTPQEYGGLRREKPAAEGVSGNRRAPPKKKKTGVDSGPGRG